MYNLSSECNVVDESFKYVIVMLTIYFNPINTIEFGKSFAFKSGNCPLKVFNPMILNTL